MNRLRFDTLLFLLCLVPIVLFSAEPEPAKPNILFIAINDLNACLSCMHGETRVATPHLDALAERGVLFANAHCAAPACNPSRTSVLTGLAPHTSGVFLNPQDWRQKQEAEGGVMLPQHFKNTGYEVRGGGKLYHAASLSEWHYTGLFDPRPWDEYFPLEVAADVKRGLAADHSDQQQSKILPRLFRLGVSRHRHG